MARIWSSLQENFFGQFVTGTRHLIVRARAGTGKTTSIVEAVMRLLQANATRSIVICAFNKNIAEELITRFVGFNVTVKTLHAIGLSCVKRFWPDVKVAFTRDRENDLAPHATTGEQLLDIAIKFECEPEDAWSRDGFGVEYVCTKAAQAMALAANEKPVKTGIDGSDMIFLPVRNGWLHPMCDDVVVDEAQDMTAAQLEIAQGICRGRITVVGDDKQAIYGFRGADSGSIDRLKSSLDAIELPLNITYRCAQSIVREAQYYVPDFQAGESNPEGSVSTLEEAKLTSEACAGDFILSRVNAPLVSVAMSLLRAGKRTRIAGRDIGAGLIGLIRKFKSRSIPDLLKKISAWEEKEKERLLARFKGKGDLSQNATYMQRFDAISDQAEMLTSLTDNATNVQEVESRITALFTDDGLGAAGMITCSSVHKAKGLEADRVFILADTLRNNSDEERNICYVAITRAKSSLVYVSAKSPADAHNAREGVR
jgi:DNA helicase-2/ATP-dependent DNA helicase PcrA